MTNGAQVLIVGAGPTGLALANALQHLGTSYMLIEASPTLSLHTKATNLMPGTLEQLAIYNLSQPMYQVGGIMKRYLMNFYGANVGPREMHLSQSEHPNVLFLGQDKIEDQLAKALPGQHSQILFNHRLISLRQDKDGVVALIEHEATEWEWRFQFVVGADGPRSVTRKGTACDFTPVRTGKYVWQVDAKLRWNRLQSMEQMWLLYYDKGFGAVIHLPGGMTKVMVFEPKDSLPNRNPTLEEMQSRLQQMIGDSAATLSDPTWFSHGELLTGVAPTFIDGRIILAGDACNPILPNGGQGLNIGIQDALNLAWKLHDVVHGYADYRLLETYNLERRRLRLELEQVQIKTLQYTLPAPAFNQKILRRFGNAILNKFWPKLAFAFSQLGNHYRKSTLTANKGLLGVKGGHRLLNAPIVSATNREETTRMAVLNKPKWKVLLFDAGQNCSKETEALIGFWGHPTFITTMPMNDYQSDHLHYDLDGIAHKRYNIKRPTVLVVRPDNYLFGAYELTNFTSLKRDLANWYSN